MFKSRIYALVETIPPAAKIYTEPKPVDGKDKPPTESEVIINRRAHALLDPAFPWHYAEAFAQLKQPLPGLVDEPWIKMAYDHILGRAINDDINEAQIFQHPKWETKRGFLESLLLLPDLRLDEVAGHAGISGITVLVYATLFFNVRDRLSDKLFMNELCYADARLVEFQPEYWNNAAPRDLMLRAAFNGDLQTVLDIFGAKTSPEAKPAETLAKRVKERILAGADFVVRAGGANSKVPVLDSARKLIVATEKYAPTKTGLGDDEIGLTAVGLSVGESIMATINGICENEQYNRLRAFQEAGNSHKN